MDLCDPVLVMASGDLLLQGSCEEVCADDRVVEAFLGSRVQDHGSSH